MRSLPQRCGEVRNEYLAVTKKLRLKKICVCNKIIYIFKTKINKNHHQVGLTKIVFTNVKCYFPINKKESISRTGTLLQLLLTADTEDLNVVTAIEWSLD